MVKCPRCGYDNPDYAMYCIRCGFSLSQQPYTPLQGYPQRPLPTGAPTARADLRAFSDLRKGALSVGLGLILLLTAYILVLSFPFILHFEEQSIQFARQISTQQPQPPVQQGYPYQEQPQPPYTTVNTAAKAVLKYSAYILYLYVVILATVIWRATKLVYGGQRLTRRGFRATSALGLGEGVAGTILMGAGVILFVTFFTMAFILHLAYLAGSVGYSTYREFVTIEEIWAAVFAVGMVLTGLAYLRSGGMYGSNTVRLGGILVMASAIIFLVFNMTGDVAGTVVGTALLSAGFLTARSGYGSVSKSISTSLPAQTSSPGLPMMNQAPPTVPQPAPYQVGSGTIYSDGSIHVEIYSPYEAQIVRATVSGTDITTTDITPNKLSTGYNRIKLQFDVRQGLAPNKTYTVQLHLDNGQVINAEAKYV